MIQLDAEYIMSETVRFLEDMSKIVDKHGEDTWYLGIYVQKALNHPHIYGIVRGIYEEMAADLVGKTGLAHYYDKIEFDPEKYIGRLKKWT